MEKKYVTLSELDVGALAVSPTGDTIMRTTYTIPKKMSGTGNIHDIASDQRDIDIIFDSDEKYAIVYAAYYNRPYSTYASGEDAAAAAAEEENKNYSYVIIDREGNKYQNYYGEHLIRD